MLFYTINAEALGSQNKVDDDESDNDIIASETVQ